MNTLIRIAEETHQQSIRSDGEFLAVLFLDLINFPLRRWKLYREETLARHPAVIWLHGDMLTVEYEETPLAQ